MHLTCLSAGGQFSTEESGVRGEGPDNSHGELWSDEQLSYICKPQPTGNKCLSLNLWIHAPWQLCAITEKTGLMSKKKKFPLQKSLIENCQNRVDRREELKTLRSNYEKTQEKLRDKDKELAAAQAENQTLRLQVTPVHTSLCVHTYPFTRNLLQPQISLQWCYGRFIEPRNWCDK